MSEYFKIYDEDTCMWDVYSDDGAFWYGSYATEQLAISQIADLSENDY